MPINPQGLHDVFRVPTPYVLELVNVPTGVTTTAVPLPNKPGTISITRPGAVEIGFTFGDEPIREHGKNRVWRVEASGRSGIAARSGTDSRGFLVTRPGTVLTLAFAAFLDGYQDLCAREPEQWRLIFRAYNELPDFGLRVEVREWRYSSSAENSRFSFEWALSLEAYGTEANKVPANILAPVSDWAESLTDAINSVNDAVGALDNALVNIRADLEVLRGPFKALQTTGQLLKDVAAHTRDIATFPGQLLADLAGVFSQFKEAVQRGRVLDDIVAGQASAAARRFERAIFATWDANRTALAYSGALGVPSYKVEEAATLDPEAVEQLARTREAARRPWKDAQRALPYTLQPREDLRTVARALLGSAERWAEIARRNGWAGTRVDALGQVAQPGTRIYVPTSALPDSAADKAPEPYLVDLYMSPEGKLEVTGDGAADLRVSRQQPNLEQALRNRLLTVQGQNRPFPGYGLPSLVGGPVTAETLARAASAVTEQVQRDPRVDSIADVEVLDEGDTLAVSAKVTPIFGDAFALTVPLPA